MDKIRKIVIVWVIGIIMLFLQFVLLTIKTYDLYVFNPILSSTMLILFIIGFLMVLFSTIIIRKETKK
jgi:hypothetical protein